MQICIFAEMVIKEYRKWWPHWHKLNLVFFTTYLVLCFVLYLQPVSCILLNTEGQFYSFLTLLFSLNFLTFVCNFRWTLLMPVNFVKRNVEIALPCFVTMLLEDTQMIGHNKVSLHFIPFWTISHKLIVDHFSIIVFPFQMQSRIWQSPELITSW